MIKYFEKSHPRATKGVAIGLMVLAVGMFALFYPVISGAPASIGYVRAFEWLPGWTFMGY